MLRGSINRQKYSEGEFKQMLEQYIDLVHEMSNIEDIREITIHERRQDELFPSLILCIGLLIDERLVTEYESLNDVHKEKVGDLVRRAVELWKVERAK